MNLKVIDNEFSICKINNINDVNLNDEFVFISKTDEEISLVCTTENIPKECVSVEHNWKGFRIEGELDFSLIGIISKISAILAKNKIGIFVISTYNTDYILVKKDSMRETISVLEEQGYKFIV